MSISAEGRVCRSTRSYSRMGTIVIGGCGTLRLML